MGFPLPPAGPMKGDGEGVARNLRQLTEKARHLAAALPSNRAYLDAIAKPLERLAQ